MNIEDVLAEAYKREASDLHLIPMQPVMLRINGQMCVCSGMEVAAEDTEEALKFFTKEQREELERTGETDAAVAVEGFSRIRMNAYRQQGMYALAVRILPPAAPEPEEMGIPKAVLNLAGERKGLILIGGEAGSGKSATAACLLKRIAEQEPRHIITIENTVEYLLPRGKSLISQREIGSDTKEYARAVRMSLKQDADVIFIGELEDTDTVLEAVTAAETGRLVLASLHTCRTEDALQRLLYAFPKDRREAMQKRLAEALKGIVIKQLLPGTGVSGRRAVFEIMLADKELRMLIREGRFSQISSAMQNKEALGMQTMDDAILAAYMKSEITAETAVRYACDQENMRQRMKIY